MFARNVPKANHTNPNKGSNYRGTSIRPVILDSGKNNQESQHELEANRFSCTLSNSNKFCNLNFDNNTCENARGNRRQGLFPVKGLQRHAIIETIEPASVRMLRSPNRHRIQNHDTHFRDYDNQSSQPNLGCNANTVVFVSQLTDKTENQRVIYSDLKVGKIRESQKRKFERSDWQDYADYTTLQTENYNQHDKHIKYTESRISFERGEEEYDESNEDSGYYSYSTSRPKIHEQKLNPNEKEDCCEKEHSPVYEDFAYNENDKRINMFGASRTDRQEGRHGSTTGPKQNGRSTSSWMQYTMGTGFYQNQGSGAPLGMLSLPDLAKAAKDMKIPPDSEPPRSSSSGFGKSERRFSQKVYDLDYFFRLTDRTVASEDGPQIYSFEIEFCSLRDPFKKEVVFGYQMRDPSAAREAVFAAALKKLEEIENETLKKREVDFRPNKAIYDTSHTRTIVPTGKTDLLLGLGSVELPSKSSMESGRFLPVGSNLRVNDEKKQTPIATKPLFKKDSGDDNFKIAIPRDPNIIDEQFRHHRRADKRREGPAWQSYRS